jgi:hypothetical protein
VERAAPTERLLQTAREGAGDVYASCFPYSHYIAEYALLITLPEAGRPKFVPVPEATQRATHDFCNAPAEDPKAIPAMNLMPSAGQPEAARPN